MVERCCNCHQPFLVKTRGKGYYRRSMKGNISAGVSCTQALASVAAVRTSAADNLRGSFLCTTCWQHLYHAFKYKVALDSFLNKTAPQSYVGRRRSRNPEIPTSPGVAHKNTTENQFRLQCARSPFTAAKVFKKRLPGTGFVCGKCRAVFTKDTAIRRAIGWGQVRRAGAGAGAPRRPQKNDALLDHSYASAAPEQDVVTKQEDLVPRAKQESNMVPNVVEEETPKQHVVTKQEDPLPRTKQERNMVPNVVAEETPDPVEEPWRPPVKTSQWCAERACHFIQKGRYSVALQLLWKHSRFARTGMENIVRNCVRKEMKEITRYDRKHTIASLSQPVSPITLQDFRWEAVLEECQEKLPVCLSLIQCMLPSEEMILSSSKIGPTNAKRTLTPEEAADKGRRRVGLLVAQLLYRWMPSVYKLLPSAVGVELWRQGCSSETFLLLNSVGITQRPNPVRGHAKAITANHERGISDWKELMRAMIKG